LAKQLLVTLDLRATMLGIEKQNLLVLKGFGYLTGGQAGCFASC